MSDGLTHDSAKRYNANMCSQPATRIILWSAPRCTSTLFEHSIGRLSGVKTFHEMYTNAAYFGEERIFDRYQQAPEPDLKFNDVRATLETDFPGYRAVFCKEMAYSITQRLDALPSGYEHSFLIRSPRKAIASMYRVAISGDAPQWGDFDPRETGFEAMWELHQHIVVSTHATPVIVDSDEMLQQPRDAMQAYCDALGLLFEDAMLSWSETENRERLDRWGSVWYQTLLGSTGFTQPPSPSQRAHPPLPAIIETAIEQAQPFYDRLFDHRLLF